MFYNHRRDYYHTHGFLFILSLIAAFILGRKSEQYGYTIISRGGCSQNENLDIMEEPEQSPDYPQ